MSLTENNEVHEKLNDLAELVLHQNENSSVSSETIKEVINLSEKSDGDLDTVGLVALDILSNPQGVSDKTSREILLHIVQKARERRSSTAIVLASLFVMKNKVKDYFANDNKESNNWIVEGLSNSVADKVLKRECHRFVEQLKQDFREKKKNAWVVETMPIEGNKLGIWMSKNGKGFTSPRLIQ